MNYATHFKFSSATLPLALLLIASVASAQQGGTAKGTLTLQGSDGSSSVTFAHAYYVTAPDSFDKTKPERRLVFTAEDQAAAIAACDTYRCAQLPMIDGLTFYLADQGMANWWAHVGQTQMSGVALSSALKLRVDTPDHLAGTFKIGGGGASATATIEFDAKLTKAFDQ